MFTVSHSVNELFYFWILNPIKFSYYGGELVSETHENSRMLTHLQLLLYKYIYIYVWKHKGQVVFLFKLRQVHTQNLHSQKLIYQGEEGNQEAFPFPCCLLTGFSAWGACCAMDSAASLLQVSTVSMRTSLPSGEGELCLRWVSGSPCGN